MEFYFAKTFNNFLQNQCFPLYQISGPIRLWCGGSRSRPNIQSECCQLLQKLRNVKFEIKESSEVLIELQETLKGTLERLYSATNTAQKN